MKEGAYMSFEDIIKRTHETKQQLNQTKSTPTFIKQTINLGKGIPTNYERNNLGRPTYEDYEGDTTGDPIND